MSINNQQFESNTEYYPSELERSHEHQKTISLKRRYPISIRYPFLISLPWFGALIGIVILFASADSWIRLFHPQLEFLYQYKFEAWVVIFSVLLVLICKLTYGLLYRENYSYTIQGDVFTVSRGVLLKRRVSISLAREPDVYVGRRWRHFLLGLYYVEVVTPASKNSSFIRIDGLTRDTAYAMQQYLVQKINSPNLIYSHRSYISDTRPNSKSAANDMMMH